MELNSAIKQLVETLENSQEYKIFLKAKKEIDKEPELTKLINEFNKKQKYLYKINLSHLDIQKKIKEIDFEYNNLLNIPKVLNYFDSGEKFNLLINNVMNNINQLIFDNLKN